MRLRCGVRPDKAQAALLDRLGLRIPERLSDPLQLDFLYSQTRAIYLIGAMILVLVAVATQLLADVVYTFINPRIRYS